jgi:pyridoxine/pyridoxamine 5'-phosphate oxidase
MHGDDQGSHPMDDAELLRFMRAHRYAMQSSVSPLGCPQSAVVGIAISDAFELVFDTLASTRKAINLKANPRVAFVIGGCDGGEEQTVQFEGEVDFPSGAELERIQQLYFSVFPEGRQRLAWAGITYARAKPRWIRFSDFASDPPAIRERRYVT